MIKVIPPGSWDFGEEATRLIKVGASGLRGSDLGAFIKRAGYELADVVRKLDLAPGEVPIHLIAMGAHESYGCFFAGAPVATADGLKPIEQVQVGDLVLTHNNRYRPVTHVFSDDYTGQRCTIDISGLPLPLVTTANHPVWVVRREYFDVEKRRARHLKKLGIAKKQAVNNVIKNYAQFVPAADVHTGDFLIVPVQPEQTGLPRLPAKQAYFMGVYLAEGCTFKEYNPRRAGYQQTRELVLTMSTNDGPVVTRIKDDIKLHFSTQRSLTSLKGIRVSLHNKELAAECLQLFGKYATCKRLHPTIFVQTTKWKLEFLAGYFDGDGCIVRTGAPRCRGTLIASTASLNLALDLQRLLASINIPSSISQGCNRIANGCFGKQDNVIYQLSVGSAYSEKIVKRCARLRMPVIHRRQKQARSHIGSTHMLSPVTGISLDKVYNTKKFNLEVAEDNTYNVYVAVHNSNRNGDSFKSAGLRRDHPTFVKHASAYRSHLNKNTERSYGIVKHSHFNEAMRRVELIVALNGTKEAARRNGGLVADEELDALERGNDYDVSMSTKVAYDVCSSCGNQAKSRANYCRSIDDGGHCKHGGLRHHIGRVCEDGHILHADNPINRFFDISKVARHADRTAYVLGKVASEQHIIGGAELAELMNVTAPSAMPADDAFDSAAFFEHIKLARELADRELTCPDSEWDREFDPIVYTGPAGLSDLRETNRNMALLALAHEKVALAFPDWLRAITGAPFEKCAAAAVIAAPVLTLAHRQLLDDDNIVDILRNTRLPDALVSHKMQLWAEKQATSCSLAAEHARQRMWLSAMRRLDPMPRHKAAGAASETAQSLTKNYAAYQLHFLNMHQQSSDFPLLCDLVIRQNRVCY